MIDSLRLFGLVRVAVAPVDQPGGDWEARLSRDPSGQGDVTARAGRPDAALKAAAALFADFGRQRAVRASTRRQKAPPDEVENPEDLI